VESLVAALVVIVNFIRILHMYNKQKVVNTSFLIIKKDSKHYGN
tara:strand:- start:1690 stop:1821 length:132 start_codon:yes stop_codon:yes gene_type:complete